MRELLLLCCLASNGMSGVVHNNSNPIQRSRTSGALLHPKSGRPIASKNVVQTVIPTKPKTFRHNPYAK